MYDPFSIDYTVTLLQAVEKIEQPQNFLSEMFFPKKISVETDIVALEWRKQGRNIAPYVISGSHGPNIARDASKVRWFKAPTFAARRIISLDDLKLRQFGETPNIYNPVRPEERLAKLQAQDLAELTRLIENRRGVMSSEILQTGVLNLKSYADDGRVVAEDKIDFEVSANIVTPSVHWDNSSAKIYKDLYAASETIQENSGEVPTVAVCGKNVESYLLNNEEIKSWLLIPSNQNLTIANLQPHFTSPQARYIGRITALNLDLYSFSQTFIDDEGNKKYFVEPNNVIIGTGGGSTVYAPITLFYNGVPHTVSAEIVPQHLFNDAARTRSLTLYSSFIQIPNTFSSFITIKTCG